MVSCALHVSETPTGKKLRQSGLETVEFISGAPWLNHHLGICVCGGHPSALMIGMLAWY